MPRALRQLISLMLPAASAAAASVALAVVAHVIALWSAAFYDLDAASTQTQTELNWTKLNNSFKCQRWSRLVLSMHAQVEQLLLWFCQKAEATFSRDCTEECCQNAQITKPELHSSRRWGTEAPQWWRMRTTATCHLWLRHLHVEKENSAKWRKDLF